jgi:hypothetical protein
MAVTTELTIPHRIVEALRETVPGPRENRRDSAAVRRPLDDIEGDLDPSELPHLTPPSAATTPEASENLLLDDTTLAPAPRRGAGDDGVGGYQR